MTYQPDECSQGTAHEEHTANIVTKMVGMTACLPSEHVGDICQCSAAEGEVAPLVRRADQSPNEASHNHQLVNKNNPENGWPWHASREQKVHEQQWCSNEPIDVSDVEDLAVLATDYWVGASKLDRYGREAKVRCHGEVRNRRDHKKTSRDVVENAVGGRLGQGVTEDSDPANGHHGGDSPIPVATANGNSNVCCQTIDSVRWSDVRRKNRQL